MSDGERLFAAYLRQRQIPYEFEVGEQRRPDFQVHHPITRVVCEVYEPTVRLPPQAGPFDSVSPLRGAFQGRKRRQGAEARSAGVPYVVVLGSANSDVGLDVFSVAGAAFGNVGVSFSIDPATGRTGPVETTFGSGARLQPAINTRYSAVIRLTKFNPTQYRVERSVKDRLSRGKPSLRETWRVVREVHDHFAATAEFDPEAALARVTVLHNLHASTPLPMEVFGGPHDEHWGTVWDDEANGRYTRLATGRLWFEVPET